MTDCDIGMGIVPIPLFFGGFDRDDATQEPHERAVDEWAEARRKARERAAKDIHDKAKRDWDYDHPTWGRPNPRQQELLDAMNIAKMNYETAKEPQPWPKDMTWAQWVESQSPRQPYM